MTDTPQPATEQPSTENPTPEAVAAADAGEESPVEWSTGRPVHSEIHAEDPRRAVEFYSTLFGWTSEDWSGFVGSPYFGLRTGEGVGIDGAIMARRGANMPVGGPVAGAVLTMGVADYDATAEKILAAGGREALGKHALPGMAWQGYFHDTENNVFGTTSVMSSQVVESGDGWGSDRGVDPVVIVEVDPAGKGVSAFGLTGVEPGVGLAPRGGSVCRAVVRQHPFHRDATVGEPRDGPA